MQFFLQDFYSTCNLLYVLIKNKLYTIINKYPQLSGGDPKHLSIIKKLFKKLVLKTFFNHFPS